MSRSGDLNLDVRILYTSAKATRLRAWSQSGHDSEIIKILRQDLTAFGVPHPKAKIVQFRHPDTVCFSWTTKRKNPIYQTVRGVLGGTSNSAMETRKELEILDIIIEENPPVYDDPPLPYRPAVGTKPIPAQRARSRSPVRMQPYPPRRRSPSPAPRSLHHVSPPSFVPQTALSAPPPPAFSVPPPPAFSAPPPQAQTPIPIPIPDQSHTNALTRELWDTRRAITAGRAREKAIVEELERGGLRIGTGPIAMHEPEGGEDLRTRIESLEAELTEERRRRTRAETALGDVQRECASPFVVPSLVEAFVKISHLGTDARLAY
ncbi:hypothetical protein PLICRDRAFT_44811 [Plicaturopsis crispa FD-325 SS-3]|nr:hypothetical protein PLICRDRAFT_44811 [Plicaturopsis crispa FD-325 SS-3]